MVIKENLLIDSGAKIINYNKGQSIFDENSEVLYYYQIVTGKIKIVTKEKSGREFIHEISNQGECFGEVFLILKKPYSVCAVAMENAKILTLDKIKFDVIINNKKEILENLYNKAAKTIYYGYLMNSSTLKTPASKILKLFYYLKTSEQLSKFNEVELTRQQIASLTGLRVETVIRTIKKLEAEKAISISFGKIIYLEIV